MATNYERGRDFEYRVKKLFENKGYFVVRQAKSTFPDLIAVRRETVLGIECKTTGYISLGERKKLLELEKLYGIIPMLVSKGKINIRPSIINIKYLNENLINLNEVQ